MKQAVQELNGLIRLLTTYFAIYTLNSTGASLLDRCPRTSRPPQTSNGKSSFAQETTLGKTQEFLAG